VSAIVVNWNGAKDLEICLASLRAQSYSSLEIMVVDNASTDDSEEVACRWKTRWIGLDCNRGLAAALNEGAMSAQGEFLLFLNNDVRVHREFVAALVAEIVRDTEAFSVDALQYDWEGTKQVHLASYLARNPRGENFYQLVPGLYICQELRDVAGPVLASCAAAMLVRASMFRELQGFDSRLPIGYEDVELCWRAWMRGWKSVFTPRAECWHHVGASGRSVKGAEIRFRGTVAGRLLIAAKLLPWKFLLTTWMVSLAGLMRDIILLLWRQAGIRAGALRAFTSQLPGILRERREIFAQHASSDEHLERMPRRGQSTMVALLGKKDFPTDAVEDYCRLLGDIIREDGYVFGLVRVLWEERGWLRALGDLWRQSAEWEGAWTLVQYTALMWSRRGFPMLFLLVLVALRIRGVRAAVVFHDAQPFEGMRIVDRLRRACQRWVMRCTYRLSRASILTIPIEQVAWLPREPRKAAFIPVCPTLPVVGGAVRSPRNGRDAKTIAVLGVTDGGDIRKEVSDITLAARHAAEHLEHVRLVTVGRGTARAEPEFREALQGSKVEYSALGVLPAEQVSRVLADSDVALFVRGRISTQRSSAIASIAHGIPLVAYADPQLPAPLAQAGVVGVPYLQGQELADATVRVLTDPGLWSELHERSRRTHEEYFSWRAVASRFHEVLRRA